MRISCFKSAQKGKDIVEKSADWDEGALFNLFENDWKSLGPIGFTISRAANLESAGSLWEVGNLSIGTFYFRSFGKVLGTEMD